MGTKYASDRKFTDGVHKKFAIDIIYKPLNWEERQVEAEYQKYVDMHEGIYYFFIDKNNGVVVTTQERFREVKYRAYNDFTIRFEREYNPHEDRKLSEYYKLNADYFVYGTINGTKQNLDAATGFIKYAVIDIKKLKGLFDNGYISVSRTLNSQVCKEDNGKMVCPINYNKDDSSSFIPVDIRLLYKLFSNKGIIIAQKGFI